jgi:hypothetical protein
VLSNPKTDDNVKSDAQIIIARSAMQTGRRREQDMHCLRLPKENLAEALYYDAYFKIKMESLRLQIQQFKNWPKNYSGYRYFGAKGLILMAKNFYGLKDSFQATYFR